jgi:hypothetical protein
MEIGMRRWEYFKVDLSDTPRRTQDTDLLNDAGKAGWELVFISANSIAYMKRELPAEAAPKKPEKG